MSTRHDPPRVPPPRPRDRYSPMADGRPDHSAAPRKHHVLLVDASDDNREVIGTALRRRGINAVGVGQPDVGLQWAREYTPDVIVLETEWDDRSGVEICREYVTASRTSTSQVLLLGHLPAAASGVDDTERVAKPYHYAPLIRRIEEMIEQARGEPR